MEELMEELLEQKVDTEDIKALIFIINRHLLLPQIRHFTCQTTEGRSYTNQTRF